MIANQRGSPRSPGEVALQNYLVERSLGFRYEPATSGPNPDFEVDHPRCGRVIMDVVEPEFRLPRNPDGSYHSGANRGPEEALRRALNSDRKKDQAQVAIDAGHPFVIVYARTNSEMSFEPHQLAGALFGNLQFRFPLGDDTPPDRGGTLAFGPGGRLQQRLNTRFSAVAVIAGFNPGFAEVERIAEGRFHLGMTPSQQIAKVLEVAGEEKEAGRYNDDKAVYRLTVFHNPFAQVVLSPEFAGPVSYTHLRAHETVLDLVCRLLLEKKKTK